MSWVYLFLAGILEIVWAYFLKKVDGFSKPFSLAIMILAMILSFWLLNLSLRTLPLGLAYAVWTGIGIAGTVIVGILFLGEEFDILKIVCIAMILVGIFGLKLLTP
ncbi:DMT family transporter [Criblamydia sequanensis]|uniref:Guanidinium exporter n=1 Tax=Candidatus Criblamydia sequanensis CRIB-18 TaxID=1437425 RepID=A0A090E0A8_9BACT|nr:multidrug efflux SMR transporter [Criblamydia sequanensis]CDR34249.1 Small multidrug resistance protein [Criblamydia sequanensis CRIB-18]